MRKRVSVEKISLFTAAAGIADHTCCASGKNDRPMPSQLEPTEHDLTQKISRVQRICCRIEPDIHPDRTRRESLRERRAVCRVVDETSKFKIGEQGHGFSLASRGSPVSTYYDAVSKVLESLEHQALACRLLGSFQYADLLDSMAEDCRQGGLIATLLLDRCPQPIHDALPLRLLGFLHHAALSGSAPELAERFASCGGDGQSVELEVVFDVLNRLSSQVDRALSRGVQTNEVGRSICHLTLANWLPTQGFAEFDLWEIGSSAGLNLSFDHYAADTGAGVLGREGSALTFPPKMFVDPPPVHRPATCVDRRGCDLHPIDLASDSTRLASFIWPDQSERRDFLLKAIEITRTLNHPIDRASADDWLSGLLASPSRRPVVVFHSIVWQYMDDAVRRSVREQLFEAGSSGRSLVWARMEPAGPVADLRADLWVGGGVTRFHLADVGYHGQGFRWLGRALSD